MPLSSIRSVYAVANDMDLMRFTKGRWSFRWHSGIATTGVSSKPGRVSFALSSLSEAAKGARGSLIVFDAIDVAAFVQRIERLGGPHLSNRNMGSHRSVATFADPDSVSAARPGRRLSLAKSQQVDSQQGCLS
jgi:hypothetical protein